MERHSVRSQTGNIRRHIVKLLLIGLGLLLAAEFLLRNLVLSPSIQTFDPELGYVYLPGGEIFQAREGISRIQLNTLGLNNSEPLIITPGLQVLVLGDSYTEALQVPRRENFVNVAATLSGLEIINGGRSGLGPAHYPVLLNRLSRIFKTDLIVICLTLGDIADLEATPRHVIRKKNSGQISKIIVRPSANNKLRPYIEPAIHHSALATIMMGRMALLAHDVRIPTFLTSSDVTEVAATDTDAELLFLFGELNRQHKTAFLYIPVLHYLPGGHTTEIAASVTERHRLKATVMASGAPFIDAGPMMRAAYARGQYPLAGFQNARLGEGHLNTQGHAAVAEALVQAIHEAGL